MSTDPKAKYKVPAREELKANARVIGMIFASSPAYAGLSLVLQVIQGLIPAAFVFVAGRLVTQLTGQTSSSELTQTLVLIAILTLAQQVLQPLSGAVRFAMELRFQYHLTGLVMSGVAALPGIAHFEDPDFRDKLKVSEWIGHAPSRMVRQIGSVLQSLAGIVGFVGVTATFALWAPITLIGAAIPVSLLGIWLEAEVGHSRWRHSEDLRKSDYAGRLGTRPDAAKEYRIFRLGDWLGGRFRQFWLEGMKEAWRIRRRGLLWNLALMAPSTAALAFVYWSMLTSAIDGRIDVGRFGASSMAATALASSVASFFSSIVATRQANIYVPVALQIIRLAQRDPRLDVSGTADPSSIAHTELQLKDVSFTYPGSTRPIFQKLNLTIRAGTSVAIVGANGAGKTTLIKLLCRHYDPDQGNILLDGVDIREFDLVALRERMAVIFQDFAHYLLPAKDNVGFGAVARMDDRELLRDAAGRVGVLDMIEELPDGWDTPLAREFDGVDLSGGEWQRVALARAMTAMLGRDADVLVLDEPTASLDVRIEHQLYEHFAKLVAGRTTILVSHRFSTVRMAERIVLLENGLVLEDGSHQELLSLNGKYAELYRMQASHFQEATR